MCAGVVQRLTIVFLLVGWCQSRNLLSEFEAKLKIPLSSAPDSTTTGPLDDPDVDYQGSKTDFAYTTESDNVLDRRNYSVVDYYELTVNGTIVNGTEFEYQSEIGSGQDEGQFIIEVKHLAGRAPPRPCNRNERRVGGKCKLIVKPCKDGHIVVDGKCKLVVPD